MKTRFALLIAALLILILSKPGLAQGPGVLVQQEGITLGRAGTVNCTPPMLCAMKGSVATITSSGGVTGTGTTGVLTQWTDGAGGVLGDSAVSEDASNVIVTGRNVLPGTDATLTLGASLAFGGQAKAWQALVLATDVAGLIFADPTGTAMAALTTVSGTGQLGISATSILLNAPTIIGTRTGTPLNLATFDNAGTLVEGAAVSSLGTVTSVATSAPITGGPITTSGTVACSTCNAMTNNPYVVPSSVPATGGIIGGGVGIISGVTTLFAGTNVNVHRMATVGDGWIRNLALNYAAAQPSGAWSQWAVVLTSVAGVPAPPPVNLGVLSGEAAGVKSAPLLYRVLRGSPIALLGSQTTTAVGATTPTGWAAEFVMDDGGDMVGSFISANLATTTTRYVPVYSITGASGLIATEAAGSWVSPITGTVKNLCFATSTTQDASGTLVATLRVNGAPTTVTATQAAGGGAGIFCDLTHTGTVMANQTVALEFVNNATAGTTTIQGFTLELLPTTGTPGIVGGYLGTAASNSTNYYKPFAGVVNATETNVRVPMPRAGTVTNFCAQVSTGSSGGTTATVTLVKTGIDTALTFTTTTATAQVYCATGSVAFAANDTMSVKVVQGNGGSTVFGGWAVDY